MDLSLNRLSDQILSKSEYKNNPANKKIIDIYREITILLQSSNRYTQISSFYKQIKVNTTRYNSRVYVTAARNFGRKQWKCRRQLHGLGIVSCKQEPSRSTKCIENMKINVVVVSNKNVKFECQHFSLMQR